MIERRLIDLCLFVLLIVVLLLLLLFLRRGLVFILKPL
jgi:hypothetical protein